MQSICAFSAQGTAEMIRITMKNKIFNLEMSMMLVNIMWSTQHLLIVRVHIPPFHIKLGLMKNCVKGIDHGNSGFQYLKVRLKGILTNDKLEPGAFIGPQIRSIIHDSSFPSNLHEMKLDAWTSFAEVVRNFLGNHKAENYCELAEKILRTSGMRNVFDIALFTFSSRLLPGHPWAYKQWTWWTFLPTDLRYWKQISW